MKHYAGLDVSVEETSICIVDESGKFCREKKVVSHPEDLVAILSDPAFNLERVGIEAGPLSQWLFEGLAKAGIPIFCIETRHTKAFLDALQPNKSDRNDARGIAHMMRVGLFKDVHVKTLTGQKRRALLTARSLLQEKAIDLENEMRGLLRNFGLKVGRTPGGTFEERIRELVETDAELAEIMEPLLAGRRKLREGLARLEDRVRSEAKRCQGRWPATADQCSMRNHLDERLVQGGLPLTPLPGTDRWFLRMEGHLWDRQRTSSPTRSP